MKTNLTLAIVAMLAFSCSSQRQADSQALNIENTYWKLVEAGGNTVTTPADGREVYMTLTKEGGQRKLQGHAGCNGLGGDYKLDGDAIKFQAITTRMFCESRMEVENLFTRMLSAADRYRITGNTLELYSGSDLLGKFEAKPGKF